MRIRNRVYIQTVMLLPLAFAACTRQHEAPTSLGRNSVFATWPQEGGHSDARESPQLVKGHRPKAFTLYFGDNGQYFYAVDARTGRLRWRVGTSWYVNAASDGRYLYLQDGHRAYVVDPRNGRQVRRLSLSGRLVGAGPMLRGPVAFFTVDASVQAVQLATGQKEWTFTTGLKPFVGIGDPTPSSGDDTVYAAIGAMRRGTTSGIENGRSYFVALDPATGRPIWRLPGSVTPWGRPVIQGDRVYVSNGILHAYTARHGKSLWTFTDRFAPTAGLDHYCGSPAVVAGSITLPCFRTIYRLQAGNGGVRWHTQLKRLAIGYTPSLVTDGKYVLVVQDDDSTDAYLYLLNAETGKAVWSRKMGDPVSTPIVANGMVYMGCDDHYLYALYESSGKTKWKFRAVSEVRSSPLLLARK